MQSYSKRMDKGNPVAWRLRHFSWRSRVTSEVIISVFYIHWKKIVRRDWYGNPSKIAQSPEAWGFASHPCSQSDRRRIWTYISDIQVSILITELSFPPPPFVLFGETDYIPVFWCIGSQPMGIWTKQTSFPSFFPDRKGFSIFPSSNELGTQCFWQRLFLWSR